MSASPREFHMYRRILAPVDGSEVARRGLDEAVALARVQGAQLRLLHVLDASLAMIDPAAFLAYDELMRAWRAAGERVLDDARRVAAAQGVVAETVLRDTTERRVAPVVVAEANQWGADLIVMGTHGRRGVSHLVLGSDAELVLRMSRVPVLMVRGAQ